MVWECSPTLHPWYYCLWSAVQFWKNLGYLFHRLLPPHSPVGKVLPLSCPTEEGDVNRLRFGELGDLPKVTKWVKDWDETTLLPETRQCNEKGSRMSFHSAANQLWGFILQASVSSLENPDAKHVYLVRLVNLVNSKLRGAYNCAWLINSLCMHHPGPGSPSIRQVRLAQE